DTALQWIFNHRGNNAIIVLIDVDETYDHSESTIGSNSSNEDDDNYDSSSNVYGPIYTPLSSTQEQEQQQQQHQNGSAESEGSGPYGLALLRVIAHYVAIGARRVVNIARIGR
ncbi:hypothetical protein LPJ66_009713, partial [Kickxella alabastrina]